MKQIMMGLIMLAGSITAMAGTAANYLFIQAAPSATLTHIQGNRYQLVLKNSDQDVWYFSDRPVRKSGAMTLTNFSKLWSSTALKDNFTAVPPNAAIALANGKKTKTGLVAVLGKPVVQGNQVTYTLSKISENSVKTGNYSQVLIFIDNVQWNPGGF